MVESKYALDKEQQFLLSREARSKSNTSDRSTPLRQHSEDLHTFWSILRSKLSSWDAALDELEGKPQGYVRQEIENLKEELQQLRKHCLASTVCFDSWKVPDLPIADLRLLHTEFTKHSTRLEVVKERLIPRGKFIFQRYRKEVAKKKSLGIPLHAPTSGVEPSSTKQIPSISVRADHGPCLEDLSGVSISIDFRGKVEVDGSAISLTISTSALLVRNLRDCRVTM